MRQEKILAAAFMGIFFLFMSGCSTHKPLYEYGEYSDSYYDLKKSPTPESELAYQKSLEYAIANASESRSGRVPPGIYANLGYFYLKSGNTQKAIENFTLEKSIYPEAQYFMDRMINRVKAMEKKDEK